jgi:chorismate-pyruvate lyase
MPLGSSILRDTQEELYFIQDGALLYWCFMFARGFAAISLLGGLGVEDHQNGLMPLGSSVFRDTQEEPYFIHDGALPYLCFMFARGFAAISLLGGLGVEDYQNGLMPLGSSVFRDTHKEQRFMQDGVLLYLCFMFARGFAAISLLGGLGVEATRMVSRRLAFVSFMTLKKNRALCKMVHYHICASC